MHFLKQNDSLTVLEQCVISMGENINENETSVGRNLFDILGRLNVYLPIFWDYDRYRLVLYCYMTLHRGYVFVAEVVARNFSTRFLKVLR